MDANQFRTAAHSAVEEIIQYYETLPERRVVSNVSPGYLRPLLPAGPPQHGEPWQDIQADIESKIMPGLTHWQSPNFMAFFPANSSYPGILGDMYSGAFTAPAFNWICSPAVTELETVVMDWLADLLALPKAFKSDGEGGGVIQGTASETSAIVMVAARERFYRLKTQGMNEEEREKKIDELRGKMIGLSSDQAHSCAQKAAMILGVKHVDVETKLEDDLAMRGDTLRKVLEEQKALGREPFFLTVMLGSTGTCAVDRFDEIAEVMKDYPEVWIHVDAAYAGAALVCEEYQHLTRHMETYHSFEMNMHKWLLTNFDAGCMYVRKRSDLIDAFSITPSYLRNEHSESGFVTDYRDWQFSLGRRFRSLKIWFVMRSYGIEGLKAHIRKHIKLGNIMLESIKSRKDLFQTVTPLSFALNVIQVKPRRAVAAATGDTSGFTPDTEQQDMVEANRVTKEVYELINKRGQIFLTSNVVKDMFTIRIVSCSPMAEEKYIKQAFDVIVATTEEVLGTSKQANGHASA